MPKIHVDLMLRDAGSLRATASVTIETELGPLTIEGFKVIEKDGKPAWVGLPSKEYQRGGERKFQKMLEMSKSLNRAVTEAVLAEYGKQMGRS